MDERLISSSMREDEAKTEYSLRPRYLDEYIGQDAVKEHMRIYIEAAKKRGEPLDHSLFYGPPGLGKTTLAGIVANEMGVSLRVTSGPAITHAGDLAALLTNLAAGTCSLLTKFIASTQMLRKCCIPLWRITRWTSLSVKGRARGVSASIYRSLRSLARLRAWDF
jgi:hypothetical protein